MKKFFLALPFLIAACATAVLPQVNSPDNIRLNQLGFYPRAPKLAVVLSDKPAEFRVIVSGGKEVAFTGQTQVPVKSELSGKLYATADFSELVTPGKYVLEVDGVGTSHPFEIRNGAFDLLARASIKNYYFQRLSIPLDEKYAGKWKRNAGHPDNDVLIHASAASASRPEGTRISAPKGWYDAGDYNKYVVNSGITMGTMFSAYEDFPEYFASLNLNIPESTNNVPDLIDELTWNLRWMLRMQDPADGGVYHKLTNAKFDAMVMPDKANAPRYVVQKSTAAALDFAAVMAQAARVFRNMTAEFPGLADSCVSASRLAYTWATRNPGVLYDQNRLNKDFDPDVVTGAYGDRNVRDEFFWASCELYITTAEKEFLSQLRSFADTDVTVPSWGDVRTCGYYSLFRHEKKLSAEGKAIVSQYKTSFLSLADKLVSARNGNPLQCPMGRTAKDFVWGSSAVAANQGVVLLNAYRITGSRSYLENALHNLDYLLGRNGTGYSFVTGFGEKAPIHPHHRPSEADGIADPIPGMLSGGPNPAMQDKCKYASSFADEAFTDDVCSYASNEIAINWNAPLVYLTCAMEALQNESGFATGKARQ
jgi:endoglucanase